jgi:hypothetical protein
MYINRISLQIDTIDESKIPTPSNQVKITNINIKKKLPGTGSFLFPDIFFNE